MRALVLGAGRMGSAIAEDLAGHGFRLTVADRDGTLARAVAGRIGGRSLEVDAAMDLASVERAMRGMHVVVSAVPFHLNDALAEVAVGARASFVDLGGNDAVVRRELALDRRAARAGVCIVPDCGLAPGMVSLLVAHAVNDVEGRNGRVGGVRIRVGGLPRRPTGPLRYQLVFAIEGLINEYRGRCLTLRGGRIARPWALTGLEHLDFPRLGRLEAFFTSGGASTLPETYEGRIGDLDYKTLRYVGHCARVRGLFRRLGHARAQAYLERTLPRDGPDLVALEVRVDDRVWRLLDRARAGRSAMMRTTGFPAAVVAGMVARGQVRRRGALIPERDLDPRVFIAALLERGLRLRYVTRSSVRASRPGSGRTSVR